MLIVFFEGKVNSLAVWWSGGTQLYMYSLVKNAKGKGLIVAAFFKSNLQCSWHSLNVKHYPGYGGFIMVANTHSIVFTDVLMWENSKACEKMQWEK